MERLRSDHRAEVYPCQAWQHDDELVVRLDEPATGVATGQAAVLYDGDMVLGSATIARTARREEAAPAH